MTLCNHCGAVMIPDPTAIFPALGCVNCGRLIPRTGVSTPRSATGKAQLNRALRAARRMKMRSLQ